MSQAAFDIEILVREQLDEGNVKGDEYGTDPWVWEPVKAKYRPVLDAAAAPWSAKCRFFWTKSDNALTKHWHRFRVVWLNPPYSKGLVGRFMAKAREEALLGARVICLIWGSSDTRWYRDNVSRPIGAGAFVRAELVDEAWGPGTRYEWERLVVTVYDVSKRLEFIHESGAVEDTAMKPSRLVVLEPPGFEEAAALAA